MGGDWTNSNSTFTPLDSCLQNNYYFFQIVAQYQSQVALPHNSAPISIEHFIWVKTISPTAY